jgi:hypothetical protein
MRWYRSTLLLSAASISLGACAIQDWAPAPGKDPAQLSQDSARCRLFAHGTRPDTTFEAAGSPRDVAIVSGVALVAGGIATAAHDASTYDDCMEAVGWVPADNVKQATAGQATPATVLPVVATPLPVIYATPAPLQPAPIATTFPLPFAPPQTEAQVQGQAAAQAWVSAQQVLNTGPGTERLGLYGALCGAGDRSACLMAAALNRVGP